jgi:hypothetical protein
LLEPNPSFRIFYAIIPPGTLVIFQGKRAAFINKLADVFIFRTKILEDTFPQQLSSSYTPSKELVWVRFKDEGS